MTLEQQQCEWEKEAAMEQARQEAIQAEMEAEAKKEALHLEALQHSTKMPIIQGSPLTFTLFCLIVIDCIIVRQ